jgi:protein ImuA
MAPAPARPRPAMPAALIERLRWKLRAIETRLGQSAAALALGIAPIDRVLGGGLSYGALHEIAAARESETAAATGFALALAARSKNSAPASMIWIAEDLSLAENAAPYGPGLETAGIAPERLITVAVARGREVLWAMEEALRCRAVGVVIGEMRPCGIDRVATRRLSLAAAAGDTLGLILRTAPDHAPSAAATRWIIAATSSPARAGERRTIGPPRLTAHLVRNRRGHSGTWIMEWNSVEQRFELATHSEPVAGSTFDRPHRAAVA